MSSVAAVCDMSNSSICFADRNLKSPIGDENENSMGLCNSFLTLFDVVPLSSTGTRNVSESQYSTIETGNVFAKCLNVAICIIGMLR